MWNRFKVNNKDTRTTSLVSFWCLYCYLWTYFTPCSSASIVNFEQVNASWVPENCKKKLINKWTAGKLIKTKETHKKDNNGNGQVDYKWFLVENKKFLESAWIWGTNGHTQPRVVVLDLTVSWWLPLWKRSQISIGSFQLKYNWTKGATGQNQPKKIFSCPTFPWWLTPLNLIPFRNIDDQKSCNLIECGAQLPTPNHRR